MKIKYPTSGWIPHLTIILFLTAGTLFVGCQHKDADKSIRRKAKPESSEQTVRSQTEPIPFPKYLQIPGIKLDRSYYYNDKRAVNARMKSVRSGDSLYRDYLAALEKNGLQVDTQTESDSLYVIYIKSYYEGLNITIHPSDDTTIINIQYGMIDYD